VKTDLEPVPRRLANRTSVRVEGWPRPLSSRGALRRLHPAREFGLAETGAAARLGDRGHHGELLLQRVVLLAVRPVLHPGLVQLLIFVMAHLSRHSGTRLLARARNPYSRWWLWIPGSPLRVAPE
jgi:hypothetical protein